MATSNRLLQRYVWLVDTVRRAGRITLEEINAKWAMNTSLNPDGEREIPQRTFHRHREAIQDIFGIRILCDRDGGNRYYIGEEVIVDEGWTLALAAYGFPTAMIAAVGGSLMVRIYDEMRLWVDAHPLHPSQVCRLESAEYSDYEYQLDKSDPPESSEIELDNILRRVLALGASAEVHSPSEVRAAICRQLSDAIDRYR